jgi:hypothetical protein
MNWKQIWGGYPRAKQTESAASKNLTWGLLILGPFMAAWWLAGSLIVRSDFAWRPFLRLTALWPVMYVFGLAAGAGIAWLALQKARWRWLWFVVAVIVLPIGVVALGEALPWDWATKGMTSHADKAIKAAQFAWMWGMIFGTNWMLRGEWVRMMVKSGLVIADQPKAPPSG